MPIESHENPEVREAIAAAGGKLAAGSSNSNSHNGILGVRENLAELVSQLAAMLPRIEERVKKG